jgi:hypothetical protein
MRELKLTAIFGMLPGRNRHVFGCLRNGLTRWGHVNEAIYVDAKWLIMEPWGRLWPAYGWKGSREARLSGVGIFNMFKEMKRATSRIYQK